MNITEQEWNRSRRGQHRRPPLTSVPRVGRVHRDGAAEAAQPLLRPPRRGLVDPRALAGPAGRAAAGAVPEVAPLPREGGRVVAHGRGAGLGVRGQTWRGTPSTFCPERLKKLSCHQ